MSETETPLPLTPLTKRLRSNSRGEELYSIHLQRMSAPDPHPEDAEDDHDYETPRKLLKTIGEELFEVHLKRSQDLQPDYDVDTDAKGSDEKQAAEVEEIKSESKARYNLRTCKNKTAE